MEQTKWQKYRLNYVFSKKDVRDYQYKSIMALHATNANPSPDLRSLCSPVKDQGQEGSCSSFASSGMHEFLQKKINKGSFVPVAENFIYREERYLDGTIPTDAGVTTLKDAATVLTTKGAPQESLYPYSPDTLYTTPSAEVYGDAARRKCAAYYYLASKAERIQCLQAGYPFFTGITCFSGIQSEETAETGVLPMPAANEQPEGGHAILCVGYDASKDMWIYRNSWGLGWGIEGSGYFYIPDAYINNFADDFYTVRMRGEGEFSL
jgi:C1A family cysteine protease